MLVAAAVGGLAGCATAVFNPATNEPLSAATPRNMGARTDFMRENSIVLSLSGGGLRAAAFAHGVLTALESVKTAGGDLLDDVALISSVSGSSLTAAYYGVYGREGLARFRSEGLLPRFESGMRLSLYSVADAVAASMAVPVLFAPVVVRTFPESCEPLPAEIAAIRPRPEASRVLNSIAKAVTAYRDPVRIGFIKLADGGLTDNFAVSTLVIPRLALGTPYAPMTERDAVKIRRLLLIVADASQGPNGDWTLHEAGPSGVDLARSATDAAVDSAARYAADALGRMIQEWQDSVIAYRCGLKPADVIRLGGPAQWNCSDVKFSLAYLSVDEFESPMRERIEAVPTRLTLEADQVDVAIEGARQGTLALRRLRTYLRDRGTSGGRLNR